MRRWRADREFVGVVPGVVPPDIGSVPTRRVRHGLEWRGEAAVDFQPPRGVSPAMAGLLVDSRVDARDLAAMVVDLVMRGWFVAERHDGAWILERPEEPPVRDDRSVAERRLEQALLPRGGSLDLAHPRGISARDLSRVRAALREQAVDSGWYRRDPQPGGVRRLAGRVPRTALGTAVRVQTLGFRRYLATAEADQISFEEAAGEFSRYLPWALVFGLAKQWTRVMREVGRRANVKDATLVAGDVVLDPFAMQGLFQLGEFAATGVGELAGGLFAEDGLLALGEGADLFGDLFDTIVEAVGAFDITDLFG